MSLSPNRKTALADAVLTAVLAVVGAPAAALAEGPGADAAGAAEKGVSQNPFYSRGDRELEGSVRPPLHSDDAEGSPGIRPGRPESLKDADDLEWLLPLRRQCLNESPCALAMDDPISTHAEFLPLADEMSARVVLELSHRQGVCIVDDEGKWAKRAGEDLASCDEDNHVIHHLRMRLDPVGDGFMAALSFRESIPRISSDSEKDGSREFSPVPAMLRLRTTFDESTDIPFAAERLAQGLGDAMGTEAPSVFDVFLMPPEPPTFHVNLKLGNTLSSLEGIDFSAFTLRFDLEFDYYIRPYLTAFIEVGFAIGNASDKRTKSGESAEEGGEASEDALAGSSEDGTSQAAEEEDAEGRSGSFSMVPVNFGLKFNPLYQYALRPYVGMGIGLGILSDLVTADERELTLSFSGILGVAWVPFNHLGFNLETSLNFDELRVEGGSNLLFGFSINFGMLFLF